MIVQDKMVKGGIAAVISGYYGSKLEQDYDMIYVESYKDGGKLTKLWKGICGYFHFAKVLLFSRPDIVHMHSSFGPSFYRSLPFIYMASWAKKPMINHIHGADFDEFYVQASEKKKKLIKRAYSKCRLKEIIEKLNQILTGYNHYYGITDNTESITAFRYNIMRSLFYCLNRRSQKKSYNWVEFLNMLDNSYPLVRPRIYVNIYE